METAKLGPLAFYKVPNWGCVGRAGRAECGETGREQRLRSRMVLGQEPSRLCCRQPECFLHQAFVCQSPAWPRRIASLGLFWACSLGLGSSCPVAPAGFPNGNAGNRQWCSSTRCMLLTSRCWSALGPYVPGLGAVIHVFRLTPGRAPAKGFRTQGFFPDADSQAFSPLQPVCSSSPDSVQSPSEPGAVGSDPGFYRDSAYVVVMLALMCWGGQRG